MNKIKHTIDVFSGKNHGYALNGNKDQTLSRLITRSSFSKIALAIGLTFSASAAWSAENACFTKQAARVTICDGDADRNDVKAVIGGANVTVSSDVVPTILGAIAYGDGNATLITGITNDPSSMMIGATGVITIKNEAQLYSLYAESLKGKAIIQVMGEHFIEATNSAKTAIFANGRTASTIKVTGKLDIVSSSIATDSHGIAIFSEGQAILDHQGYGTIATTTGDAINVQTPTTGAINIALTGSKTGIVLSTRGDNYNGITASTGAVSGDVVVDIKNTTLSIGGQNGNGIYVEATNVTGSTANLTVNTDGGTIDLNNVSAASTDGNYGIIAVHRDGVATGNIVIENSGTNIVAGLASSGAAIHGAFKNNAASSGHVTITNRGELTTQGQNVYGIHGENSGTGNVAITSSNNITTANATGIYALVQSGNATIDATGNITTGQATASNLNHAIEASSQSGEVKVKYGNGTIKVIGNANSGGNALGISAWDNGSGNTTGNAKIELTSGAIIDASEGVGALHLASASTGIIDIASGVQVKGGHSAAAADNGYAINMYSTSNTDVTDFSINNAGQIDALSDQFIRSSAITDSVLTVNNDASGNVTGYLTFGDENSTLNNHGVWNIRHFADTTGNGIRDTKAVAIADFGDGNDIVKNEASGTINLSEVPLTTRMPVNHDSSYLGYQTVGALDISNAGIVQGHLVNVTRLENRGTINLTENGQAGDVFVITSNATATSTAGNSTFIADGGFVKLDTVLNEGGINSLSDILVVDNVEAGTQKTTLIINHVDGAGALTEGDGIKVVEVLGTAESGSFELGNVVRSGLYEYTLFEGSQMVAGDDSLFLRTSRTQVNPDVGSYLVNQAAATGLFTHTLHDRLGEPQYYENYLSEDKTIPALWIRAVSGHTKNEAAGGRLKQHSVESLIHLGGEIANWTSNGEDRYHLGIMGAYGRSEAKTKSKVTGNRVDSTVDGYGVGAYLTWYDQPTAIDGWYGDLWSMYNWFENKTEGSEKYDSNSWTVSLELGYASKLKSTQNYYWMIEPQAQVAYHHYRIDKIKDYNGLDIINHDKGSVTTRLGVRTYLRPNELYRNSAQPFVEINWWNADHKNSMLFDGEKVSGDTPRNRFEVKVGVQGEMTKNVQIYSHIGMQWGKDSYEHTEGQLGLRYRF